MVGDWKEAVNSDGVIRIPLQNPDGHSWTTYLAMGTPIQRGGYCVLDNNHAFDMVFSKDCKTCPRSGSRYDKNKSMTFEEKYTPEPQVQDVGLIVEGKLATDRAYIG